MVHTILGGLFEFRWNVFELGYYSSYGADKIPKQADNWIDPKRGNIMEFIINI